MNEREEKDSNMKTTSRIKEVEPSEQAQPEPSPTCDKPDALFAKKKSKFQEKERPVRLFVGQVPDSMVEPHIIALFGEKQLDLLDAAIIRDKNTGRHRHCAFITVKNRTDADLAIKEFHNTRYLEAMANPMQVREANQPKSKAAYAKLREYSLLTGTPMPVFADSDNEHVNKEPTSGGMNYKYNRYSYQQFQQHMMAAAAYFTTPPPHAHHQYYQQVPPQFFYGYFPSCMPPQPLLNYQGERKDIFIEDYSRKQYQQPFNESYNREETMEPNGTVYFSPTGEQYSYQYNSFNQQQQSTSNYIEGPPGANLFVNNLPNTFSDEDLMHVFAPHGNILSCKVFIDRFTQRSKGFGFVSFGTVDEAKEAIKEKNGYEIEKERKILVELKRPRRFRFPEVFP